VRRAIFAKMTSGSLRKGTTMGRKVRLDSDEQFTEAIKVLNELPGMWHSRGDDKITELLLLDSHYQALLMAGVIPPNGVEVNSRGKKAAKKAKS
jgi:hypothetical protein